MQILPFSRWEKLWQQIDALPADGNVFRHVVDWLFQREMGDRHTYLDSDQVGRRLALIDSRDPSADVNTQ